MKSWRNHTKMFIRRKSSSADAEKPENSFSQSSKLIPKKIVLGGSKKIEDKVDTKNVEVWPTPIKSESDKKEYQVVRLSNGIIATLISDSPNLSDTSTNTVNAAYKGRPGNQKPGKITELAAENPNAKETKEKLAACALTVEVGSFSDPDDIQGLAHFLEHMIFMGSKKYPKENTLDVFLSKYGGFQNASTECEYTSYYLACPEKQLFKAMDIFAHFFVSPLLKWNAINREREAIESEFQQVFTDDDARVEQLLCSLAANDNPARKFSWGNQYTLRENVKNKHLHEALNGFRKTHYSSDRMKLAVQGRLPLETLKNWVTTCFSAIPKLPNTGHVSEPKQLFDMERFCRFYYVKSTEDVIKLKISWILPPVLRRYKTKPLHYLAFVIGHEGKGSLLSSLKRKLWAVGLQAGYEEGLLSNELYTVFSISVTLTDAGKEAVEEVVTATFSYLNMLKETGPDKRLFDEIQSVNETDFRFQEELDAEHNVQFMSTAMLLYPPEDYLRGPKLFFEYSPEEIVSFLSRMSPSDANIMLLSKNHSVKLDQTEFWFKTKYSSVPVSNERIRKWQNIKPYTEFRLPEKNQFITTDFRILQHHNVPKYPKKISLSDSVEFWYKGDDKFLLPVASVSILIVTPKIIVSPENWVMTSLFTKLLYYQLNEELYGATTANLVYALTFSEIGLRLMVYGYNQRLGLLVERLARGLKSFKQNVDEKVYQVFQKRLTRSYYNSTLEASILAEDVLGKAEIIPGFSYAEKYAAIKSVSLEHFLKYAESLFDQVHFQALVQGNLSEQDGVNIVSKVVDIIERKESLSKVKFPLAKVKTLHKGEQCLKLRSFNLEDKNCVTTVYYQLGPGTIRDSVILELFIMILQEPLFDKLRTKQQLGYEVSASARETNGILGISITVLSQISKFPVQQVKEKIDEFLLGFVKNFSKIGSEDFANFRQSLIDSKNSEDASLSDEVSRNLGEILKQEFIFDRLQKEIEVISKLDIKAVSSLISAIITPGTEKFRKLVVQVVGNDVTASGSTKESRLTTESEGGVHGTADDHVLPDNIIYSFLTSQNLPPGYFVTDLDEWKHGLLEYPPHKIIE